jgi:hypothetical protein
LLVQKGDRISAPSSRLNGDGQTFGGELLGVKFGSFFMSNQKQGHTVFVGFEHSLRGFFAAEGGQLQNGLHNVGHVVHVVVVKQEFVRRQPIHATGRLVLRQRLGWMGPRSSGTWFAAWLTWRVAHDDPSGSQHQGNDLASRPAVHPENAPSLQDNGPPCQPYKGNPKAEYKKIGSSAAFACISGSLCPDGEIAWSLFAP